MAGEFQDHYIRIGSVNTRYWQAGNKGSVVVMIHGLGASADIWRDNIETLAKDHRVYVPDLPGSGRSDKPDIAYNAEFLDGFIQGFLAALHLEKISLAGSSLGGGLSLWYTLHHPEQVDRLILVDSAGLGKQFSWMLRVMSIPGIGELLLMCPNRFGTRIFLKHCTYDITPLTNDLISLYTEYLSMPGAGRAFLRTLRGTAGVLGINMALIDQMMNGLETIKIPVLIIWGREDRVLPCKHGEFASAHIPNAKLHIFEKCGHISNLEKAAEFNRLAVDFLK
ncbi:MAG: alpha/beta hydrolase [Syntrophales bacterium]|jgi:4,5:9,10-diseco-3-hydroxy-5,9,17-trioxoandrosta-1(10),2-diene-4-oate hydrolase